jgi:hypothetical protein
VVTPCEPWRWYVSQPRCAYRCMQHDVNYVCLPPPPPTVVAGYQYRLCPLTDTLDEDCFKRTPVPFAKKTWLMWGDGSRMAINGTYLSEGTEPALSTWAMNPLPYSDSHDAVQFPAPCHETVDRTLNDTGRCSGRFPYAVSIVDALVVPADLVPGSYVLGFRYDCEVRAGQTGFSAARHVCLRTLHLLFLWRSWLNIRISCVFQGLCAGTIREKGETTLPSAPEGFN